MRESVRTRHNKVTRYLTKDKDGYEYKYDYENRIVEVLDDANNAVGQFAYDALGRRIRKKDLVADETTLYYYNGNWQVLAESDANGTTQRWFVYGNYIDEALMMVAACLDQSEPSGAFAHRLYYIQDGLYSTRALVADKGWVIEEQTYYDVYGRAGTWTSGDADADGDVDASDVVQFTDSFGQSECDGDYNWRCDVDNSGVVNTTEWLAFNRNGSTPANQQSYFTNPYYFTGRRVDFLDNGNLKLQHNRHRCYDYYTGRWLTQDPLGMNPAGRTGNEFWITNQYRQGLNVYQYIDSNPLIDSDPNGLSCDICGPDVSSAVNNFAVFLRSKFLAVSVGQRKRLCRCVYGFGMCSGWGWDTQLANPFFLPNCAEGGCKETVEINGMCHSKWAVNYYQWGLMHRLCNNRRATMRAGLSWSWAWSGDYYEKRDWAYAGFDGSSPLAVPAPVRLWKCDTQCCKWRLKGNLGFKWRGTRFTWRPSWVFRRPVTTLGISECGSSFEKVEE